MFNDNYGIIIRECCIRKNMGALEFILPGLLGKNNKKAQNASLQVQSEKGTSHKLSKNVNHSIVTCFTCYAGGQARRLRQEVHEA
jgi:hypothetical protein